ncbi:MAG: Fructosamine/Ketosamine-3-kinase [Gallionellaceae bacterium]|nr:MAG: Fructosamine/Ketosamine-3-kinase [Gallionellaceae bacterium]
MVIPSAYSVTPGWKAIADRIGKATQTGFTFARASPLGGGCINRAWRIEGHNGARYFVPQPVACGACGEHAFLALEFLDLSGSGNERLLGGQLAALHRCTSAQFGFSQDNTIGETPQKNDWLSCWVTFWRERRLGFQLELAARNGYGGKLQEMGRRLAERLPEFFDGYSPLPSLLHGDLWGGNHAFSAGGTPFIFDPAPYYGDRETDLAMTELFGGFGPEFYAAYRAAWPLDKGYAARKELYNLYHILNHANLFGGGYVRQAEDMMRRLLEKPC